VPWSSWNFRMTVGGFAKTSMLGSVLSESLTDSTAFRNRVLLLVLLLLLLLMLLVMDARAETVNCITLSARARGSSISHRVL
jgi:hypothetical protein